jgi:hypothetical protein
VAFLLLLDAALLAYSLVLIFSRQGSIWTPFTSPRRDGRAVLVVWCLCFLPLTLLALRGERSGAEGLASLIEPYPGGRQSWVPTEGEAGVLLAGLAATRGDSAQANSYLRNAKAAAADSSRMRAWMAETRDSASVVHRFYANAAPRSGWRVDPEKSQGVLWLERGSEVLLIAAFERRPKTAIHYLYWPKGLR